LVEEYQKKTKQANFSGAAEETEPIKLRLELPE
jgi:hypothetical protein